MKKENPIPLLEEPKRMLTIYKEIYLVTGR